VGFGELRRSYLGAHAGRERGRECSAEGASEQGEVRERGTGSKVARACGGGRKTRGCGCVHGGGVGERLGTGFDGWGPRGSKRGSVNGRSTLTERVHQTKRENGHECEGIIANRTHPPGSERERECACEDAGGHWQVGSTCQAMRACVRPGWAELGRLG
jgi:hypothetical protein